jgi:hypothetical protein
MPGCQDDAIMDSALTSSPKVISMSNTSRVSAETDEQANSEHDTHFKDVLMKHLVHNGFE